MGDDPAHERRLDSWKAIAEHLGRDVATVRRWEKSLDLPVRRVGRGHSVFAYVSEIDAWLRTLPGPPVAPNQVSETAGSPVDAPRRRPGPWITAGGFAVVVVAIAAAIASRFAASETDAGLRAVTAVDGVALVGTDGVERWRHRAPATERIAFSHREPVVLGAGRNLAVLAQISLRVLPGDVTAGGELLWLSSRGHLERTFAFDDRVSLQGGTYAEPWILRDFRVDPRSQAVRTAVVGRHFQWWPSLITVLDDRWGRHGTFVNAGWVEWIEWLGPNRLVIAGSSQVGNGGMIALLDADALDGQSPAPPDSPFRCLTCGTNAPRRYIVFPRSEVNRAAAAPVNRVTLDRAGDRVIAHSLEVPIDTTLRNADALYEMSSELNVLRASYSDRYWELHRALEADGKIDHTREQCPDRNGPRAIEVWEPATGWRTVAVSH